MEGRPKIRAAAHSYEPWRRLDSTPRRFHAKKPGGTCAPPGFQGRCGPPRGRSDLAAERAVAAHLNDVLRLGRILATATATRLGLLHPRHAIGVVAHVAVVVLDFHQAVDVGLETRAELGELARELEVVHDLLVEDLARDQQRDARRVRRDQAGGDAAFQVIDLHALGLAVRDVRIGVAGLHRRRQVRQVHLGRQPRDVVLGVERMHVLAQVLQAHALVALVLLAELRKDPPHRLVLLVIVLELLQRGQQRVPTALGDADGEHDEEAVEARLLHHHAVLGQVLGHDGRGNAGLVELAVQVQAGRDDGGLDRVQHVEAIGQLAEAVPLAAVLPALAVAADDPVLGSAHTLVGHLLGAPDLEPPVVFAELLFHLAHGAAEVQGFEQALFHEGGAAGRLHHGGRHVAAGDDAVLRAGRSVHQVRLVEERAVQLHRLRILHEHMAGLADAGQQLVDGLRRIHHRMLRARALLAHGVVAAVERVEGRVRQPGFVEMQVVHVAIHHRLDGLGVVEHAVVGGLRDRHHARFHRRGVHTLEQRIGADLRLDRVPLELGLRYRADDAEVVARGLQEHGDRPGHDDRVQDGLVAVAVHHHHVARRHRVVPHHLVRGARAVGHEETVVCVEDARRVALGFADGPVVVQQLAQLLHRIAHVGAQHVLAEELVEHLAHGALEEGDAAGVARAVPRIGAVFRVVQQRLEERRLHALQVALGLADDVLGHELRRVLEHVDEAVQLAQDVVGQVARGLGLAVHVDRHFGVLAAHLGDEVAQAQHDRVQPRAQRELLVVDRQDERARPALLLRELRQIAVARHAQHLEPLGLDRLRQGPDTQARCVLGTVVLVDDDDGKAEFHAQPPSKRAQKTK